MASNTSASEVIAERLASEIRSQESLHSGLLKDLAELAASPAVSEEDFHASFLKALGKSGLETKIQNAVFHLLRNKRPEDWIKPSFQKPTRKEPLDFMIKIQQQWERRVIKSLNAMSSELGLSLAKPRCQDEQDEILSKWNELSTLDVDLSLFRPVYAPKDFLEILSQVISSNHAPLSQEFLKRGAPASLRGRLWAQVLGTSEVTQKDREHFEMLKFAVVKNDIMLDKLMIKDVQLTSANDDNYFVFEDIILQVLLCFSRDHQVLNIFSSSCSNPLKATLRGKAGQTVIYPPNGVVPFHGFSMFCAPFCYVYADPCQLYFTFRAFYLQFCYKLHEVSSESQGIVALCALFEDLVQTYEPDLWTHLMKHQILPLKLVFRWIMRGFSGHLPPEQLLFLWDAVLAYDSMEVFSLLSATILSFRKENLMEVKTSQAVEAVLADLSSLPVIALLQLALERKSDYNGKRFSSFKQKSDLI